MKPKMILFDYGQTLVVEPQFDARRGYGAVYDRTDGGKVSRARFADFADAMFLSLAVKAHAAYHEVDDVRFLRSVCAYCDMQSRISFEDADLALLGHRHRRLARIAACGGDARRA